MKLEQVQTDASVRTINSDVLESSKKMGYGDASRIAQEVMSHLSGLVGAFVRVTIDIEADNPDGASGQIVRIVTENSQTLKFLDLGLETN